MFIFPESLGEEGVGFLMEVYMRHNFCSDRLFEAIRFLALAGNW